MRLPDELAGIAAAALAERAPFVIDIPCSDEPVPMTGHWDINALFASDPARAQ